MVSKVDIVTTYNEIFESTKEYKDLSAWEKIYSLLVLTAGSGGGGSADTVMIRDKTTNTNKLVVDSNGQIGINNLNQTLTVNQVSNATVSTITFNSSTTSSTFTIANRLALIICPAISGTPTLTLQVSLDGSTWVNTSISIITDVTNAKTIEADLLAKVAGAFGLVNAFRFSSSTSITASLNLRSIIQ